MLALSFLESNMILTHTLLIARMAKQGKSIEQVMNALRGRYTLEEVEMFWPAERELTPADEAPPLASDEAPPLASDAEAYGLPDPDEPGLTPAEKGQRTKAINKAKAKADAASTFE